MPCPAVSRRRFSCDSRVRLSLLCLLYASTSLCRDVARRLSLKRAISVPRSESHRLSTRVRYTYGPEALIDASLFSSNHSLPVPHLLRTWAERTQQPRNT